ncbi:MAG: proteasome subunit beta [Gordonia sp.]|uniref:Proteasome subunit beta n=1 Tax=Gordonia rubripertincta TaxID=36822 RepID=A0ABT4MUJ3_GORRU|nr:MULTISPECIES: proteasome subunit beta [Mycobacteriales]MBA4020846.1 proteasome subunit beta [Gordonia sp. (in: high G+C Gram-positive bacteria)]MCZ4550678.1 proteasome subunit beta [Gordonia rubripertincta]OZG28555.1 proteasome subunit beta [Williamsia sp. 1138]
MTDRIRSLGQDISSFSDYLRDHAPDLLPKNRFPEGATANIPHGTTIVAITYPGGVVIAGDRRATAGHLIASRDMRKVFITDEYSAAGIAGTAGVAIEMIRLFAVELEHYEKIEGVSLTLDGKVNRLASMVRSNLEAAMAGLAAIPLLVGYDSDAIDPQRPGRIFSFDVAGDRHEEHGGYQAIGSGSVFAKSSIKKLYRHDLTAEQALEIAVESLYDAADDDSATGGPDMVRGLYPTAATVGPDGATVVPADDIEQAARSVISRRSAAGDEANRSSTRIADGGVSAGGEA